MASTVPAIVWPINFSLPGGNPLCQRITSSVPADSALLIQGDQRSLQLYFLLPPDQTANPATNIQLVDGTTIQVAGKPTADLEAPNVLFQATGFTQLQDAGSLYFSQAFLDLNKQEIADAFAALGSGLNVLPCLAEIIISVPAQPAAGANPARAATVARYQIPVLLQRQVYLGTETNPTPATPTYPPANQVAAITAAYLAGTLGKDFLPTITSATGAAVPTDLGQYDDTALPTYTAVRIPEYRTSPGVGITTWVLEPDTDDATNARSLPALHHATLARSWRQRG